MATEKESRRCQAIDLKPPESKRIKRTGPGGKAIISFLDLDVHDIICLLLFLLIGIK